jgi:hypothetical protein
MVYDNAQFLTALKKHGISQNATFGQKRPRAETGGKMLRTHKSDQSMGSHE